MLASNPDIRSARFYGQFSLDKIWTLQAGSSVVTYPQKVPEVDGVGDVGEYDVHDGEVEEEEAVRHAAQGAERLPRQKLVYHA